MERDLAEEVPGLRCRIVPMCGAEEPADVAAPAAASTQNA
jgi:hypothetical protein